MLLLCHLIGLGRLMGAIPKNYPLSQGFKSGRDLVSTRIGIASTTNWKAWDGLSNNFAGLG
jgi:hypothetical protein